MVKDDTEAVPTRGGSSTELVAGAGLQYLRLPIGDGEVDEPDARIRRIVVVRLTM